MLADKQPGRHPSLPSLSHITPCHVANRIVRRWLAVSPAFFLYLSYICFAFCFSSTNKMQTKYKLNANKMAGKEGMKGG
jgi:hypothetical protein